MRFNATEGKLSIVNFTGPVLLYGEIVYQRKLTWFRDEAMSVFSICLSLFFQGPGSRNLGGMEDT